MTEFFFVQLNDARCTHCQLLHGPKFVVYASVRSAVPGRISQRRLLFSGVVARLFGLFFSYELASVNFCKGSRFSPSLLLAFLYSFTSCRISDLCCPSQDTLCLFTVLVADRDWQLNVKMFF